MKERIVELDYLKGVMIILMVLFHLSYIKSEWSFLNAVVYTFHMSTFLIISGFLAVGGGKSIPKILVPYIFFDVVYVIMIYVFGKSFHATNSVESISVTSLLLSVMISPSGPYWYFHTLLICLSSHWLCKRIFKIEGVSELVILGVILYVISLLLPVKMSNVMYFLLGVLLQLYNKKFTDLIPGCKLAIIPFVLFVIFNNEFDRGTLMGLVMTGLMISFLLSIYSRLPSGIQKFLINMGKNSIVIFVFSPIFTVITKPLVNIMTFDHTHILFATLSTCFVLCSCIVCAWLSDKTKISKIVFLKDKVLIN